MVRSSLWPWSWYATLATTPASSGAPAVSRWGLILILSIELTQNFQDVEYSCDSEQHSNWSGEIQKTNLVIPLHYDYITTTPGAITTPGSLFSLTTDKLCCADPTPFITERDVIHTSINIFVIHSEKTIVIHTLYLGINDKHSYPSLIIWKI